MELDEIMQQLASWGNENTVRILKTHGARDPIFGVKIGDLKKLVRKIKKNHDLSLALYNTGNSDAMYLAGLIADEHQMTPEILNDWISRATWYMISEYAVASVAAETPFAVQLANEWIPDKRNLVAAAGWATYSNFISITDNTDLNLSEITSKLHYIKRNIHHAQNRVKYTMNGFVIATGAYIPELTDLSQQTANEIGKVEVYMGKTSCKVPFAPDYIQKIVDKGNIGKKRNGARC